METVTVALPSVSFQERSIQQSTASLNGKWHFRGPFAVEGQVMFGISRKFRALALLAALLPLLLQPAIVLAQDDGFVKSLLAMTTGCLTTE